MIESGHQSVRRRRYGRGRGRSSFPRMALLAPLLVFCISTIWWMIHFHNSVIGDHSSQLERRFYLPFFREDSSSTGPEFSSCLLIQDDNHFLVEWLAYHYHALNLRHLIVAVDPKSLTSPGDVLDRWQNKISIQQWQDHDFMTKEEFLEAQTQVLNYFGGNLPPALTLHRARQRLFYYKCLQRFQNSNHGLTLLIDTDEFVRVNYKTAASLNMTAPSMDSPGSVAKFIQKELRHRVSEDERPIPLENLQSSPCIQIPRIRFTALESDLDLGKEGELVPPPFNYSHFQTMRWRSHTRSGDYKKNKISKTIIDLQRVDPKDLLPVDSIHNPLRAHCTQRRLHIRSPESLLVIHHYLGSQEQYLYRENDARKGDQRSIEEFNKANEISNPQTDDDIRPWLSGFARENPEEAPILLNKVGELWPKSWQPIRNPQRCALNFFGLPRAFREMALPSIIRNLLVPNARHQCDIYVHFFDQYKEGEGRKNKGGTIDPRDIFFLRQAAVAVARRHGPKEGRLPTVEFTHDSEDDFWSKRGEALRKYHTTLNDDGMPAYFPWNAKTYTNSSLDNMVKQWHSIEYAFRLMDYHGKKLGVTYNRVGMFRSDALYMTPIDIALLDRGVADTQNNHAVLAPFSQMPVNDRMIYGPYEAVKIWATKRFELIETRVKLRQDPGYEMHSERFLNATVLPEIEKIGVELHVNRDICFVRTRADISALVNDCSIGGFTRNWKGVDRKALVEQIVGRNCSSYKMGIRWTFVGCGDEDQG
jgi:hypothetical protein